MKNTDDIKRLERWYNVFLLIGFLGLVDIATRQLVSPELQANGTGYVSFTIGYVFGMLLGSNIAAFIMTILSIVFYFAFIWLLLAWWQGNKIKKAKSANNKEKS